MARGFGGMVQRLGILLASWLKAAALAQRGLLDPLQPPANAHFQNAEGVIVNGGRFTNVKGDVVNNIDVGVTINLTKRMAWLKMCRFLRTHS